MGVSEPPLPPDDDTPLPLDLALFNASLMAKIVEQSPRLLKEGLYVAAIPFGYNVALLAAMRQRDDGKDERLVERLAEFTFISTLGRSPDGMTHAVHARERDNLQQLWIQEDSAAYRAAHARVLAFWRDTPPPTLDPFIPTQTIVYHELIATPEAGIETLIAAYREYSNNRRLAAIDRLLKTVEEALNRLTDLQDPFRPYLAETLTFLRARLDQLRGNWEQAKTVLDAQLKGNVPARLRAYVLRAYGLSLAQTGQYVEAMEYLEQALTGLQKRNESPEEIGFTMVVLGDVNVQLAQAARGFYADPQPPQTLTEAVQRYLPLLPFPLMLYLSTQGLNFWHPDSWAAMKSQDWIVARLFGRGAHWYRRAAALIPMDTDATGYSRTDANLGWLYLNMGDARQALPRFQAVYDHADLEEFQRASVEMGIAESYWQLGKVQEAATWATKSLPIVELYEAMDLSALGEDLLGRIAKRQGQSEEAVVRFGRALQFYQRIGRLTDATAIAEELETLAVYPNATTQVAAREALTVADTLLPVRRYPTRFRHRWLEYFQWGTIGVIAILILLLPMVAVQIEQGSFLQYATGFVASQAPLRGGIGTTTDAVPLDIEPVFSSVLTPSLVSTSALYLVGALIVGLLAIYTLLGLYLVARTRFRSLQEAAHAQTLAVSAEGIALGDDPPMTWETIRHSLQADTTVNKQAVQLMSLTVLSDGKRRVLIKGVTAFYEPLRDRLLARLPATTKRHQIASVVLPSPLAWLYAISFALIALLLLGSTQPSLALVMSRDLPPLLPYSLLDLYPLLYVGLIAPPFYWLVVQPMRIWATLREYWYPGLFAVAVMGVVLAGRGVTAVFPWLLQPDIYAYSVIFLLALTLLDMLVRGWRFAFPGETIPPPPWARVGDVVIGTAAVLALVLALSGTVREMGAYFSVLDGQSELLEYQESTNCITVQSSNEPIYGTRQEPLSSDCSYDTRLVAATVAYGRALRWIPDYPLALRGLGVTHIQQGRYDDAIDDFSRLIEQQPNDHDTYLWLGSAYHATRRYDQARQYYTTAYALAPSDPRPFVNLGWLAIQQSDDFAASARQVGNPRERQELNDASIGEAANAVAFFQQALATTHPPTVDSYFALGNAYYQLGDALSFRFSQEEGAVRAATIATMNAQYDAALRNWNRAVEMEPENETAYILRATVLWRIGTTYPNGKRDDICADPAVTLADKERGEGYLIRALDDFGSAIMLAPDDDFYLRTRAQLRYLLRRCPGQDAETQLQAAVADYSAALALVPDNLSYMQYRGRLTYSLYITSYRDNPQRVVEFHPYALTACTDYARLLDLAPNDPGNGVVSERVPAMTQSQAEGELALPRYDLAYESYSCLLEFAPTAVNYFNAGLSALAVGNGAQAEEWYELGIEVSDMATLDAAMNGIVALDRTDIDLPDNTIAIFDALMEARQGGDEEDD